MAVAVLALLALTGCAGNAPPGCTGAVRQLNPDRWQAAPNELVTPRAPRRVASAACTAPMLAQAGRGRAAS